MKKRLAFTLAEVTLTLAIVGVVASMTIVPLVKDYQKKTYVQQLLKTYNDINEAFSKAMLQDRVNVFEKTKIIKSLPEAGFIMSMTPDEGEASLKEISTVLAVSKIYKKNSTPEGEAILYKKLNGEDNSYYTGYPYLKLKNGAIIYINLANFSSAFHTGHKDETKAMGGHLIESCGYLYIDVNGKTGPNVLGRDLFGYYIGNDGQLYPFGGRDMSLFETGNKNDGYWNGDDIDSDYSCKDVANDGGLYCAGRIEEDGWKMEY